MPAPSILYPGSERPPLAEREPGAFRDLHLDQVVAAILADRDLAELRPLFWSPVRDPATVAYRHEVFRDLERPDLSAAVRAFADGMAAVRTRLSRARQTGYPEARRAWILEAVEAYGDIVAIFSEALDGLTPGSRALSRIRTDLRDYVGSAAFDRLIADAAAVREALAGVRYTVHIRDRKVRVRRAAGETDFGALVEETFARFGDGAPKDYRVEYRDTGDLSHVEARILSLVAKLFPEPFRRLAEFVDAHREFPDPVVTTFDREVRFYLSIIDFLEPLRRSGLPFCLPEVTRDAGSVHATGTFDLALAAGVLPTGGRIVPNDFSLSGPERIIVVTGPNQGGKTTFARTFGQLHHLAGLGCPVPGSEARLFLADGVFTHFEREERVETLRGKLQDELVRIHEILERATPDSVIIMNETFASTSLADARRLGEEILRRIVDLGCLSVDVTFIDELSRLGEATVSMVAGVDPDDPSIRTFRLERRPADGLAYAAAIAGKYGLDYDDVLERLRC